MNKLRAILVVGALSIAATFVVAWPRQATADKPSGCQQWEVMAAPPGRIVLDAKNLPSADKGLVEPSPAGWEPFAFGPNGQLMHRRCTR